MDISVFCQGAPAGSLTYAGGCQSLPVPLPARSGKLELRFAVPILDIQGYWVPELGAPSTKLHWVITSTSAGQRSFPFMSFMNSCQVNRFSFGLTDVIDDIAIDARMNQEDCTYDVSMTVALHAETQAFKLVLDDRAVPWTDALAVWRDALNLPLPDFPAGAWQPVFCTWYAVHAAVTQAWVEKNAELAAALGFGTFIIDDGWCFDVMKRVSPKTISSWYEWIGDWELSRKKFPDYAAHRRRIRELGLNYIFWVAPFLIGEKSAFRRQFPDCHQGTYHEGYYTLDSRKSDAVAAMLDKMRRLIRDYELDGLKVDFLDDIFPNTEQPQGRETTRFIAALSSAIREAKADALIEYRQYYCTPGMMAYATQFRARDVPFDFIDNFYKIAQIRISMGDRIPVHADPVYWHPQETPANIARHMIASLSGVPMLSMDLLTISEMEKKIISFWLGFYRRHLATFRDGKWQVVYHLGSAEYARVAGGRENIVFLTNPNCLTEAVKDLPRPVTVLNLTGETLTLPGAAVCGPDGAKGTAGAIPCGGSGCLE